MELVPLITKTLIYTIGLFLAVVVISYFFSLFKSDKKKVKKSDSEELLRQNLNSLYNSQYNQQQLRTNPQSQVVVQPVPIKKEIRRESQKPRNEKQVQHEDMVIKKKKYSAKPRFSVLNDSEELMNYDYGKYKGEENQYKFY